MKHTTLALFMFLALTSACGRQAIEKAQSPPDDKVGKILLSADGNVTLNGAAITVAELKPELAKLAANGGSIWYYREQSQGAEDPRVEEMMRRILSSVVEAKLPISFASGPDFSDVVVLNRGD